MSNDPIADLNAEAAALKAKYAAVDPALIREAIGKILTGEELLALVDQVQPLYDALPNSDPLKTHVAGWLQVIKSVAVLVTQLKL